MSEYICRIPEEKFSKVRLVALDLDGTLFNTKGRITPGSIAAINRLTDLGIAVVISTGRPLSGVPFDQLADTHVDYAITTNGASVWRLHDRKCIYENPMEDSVILPALEYFQTKNIHIGTFINGKGISPERCLAMVPNLVVNDSIKHNMTTIRIHVADLSSEIRKNHWHIHKITLNFQKAADGHLIDRQELVEYMAAQPELETVSGGFGNLEITKKGVDKGVGLHALARYLGIAPEETMAIGDTENDLAIMKAAGISVAMGNAIDPMKAIADIVTLTNDEDGVAVVLNKIG